MNGLTLKIVVLEFRGKKMAEEESKSNNPSREEIISALRLIFPGKDEIINDLLSGSASFPSSYPESISPWHPYKSPFVSPGTEYFIKSELEKLELSLKAHIEKELRAQLNKFFTILAAMLMIAVAAFAGIAKLILAPPSGATKAAASLTELIVSFLP